MLQWLKITAGQLMIFGQNWHLYSEISLKVQEYDNKIMQLVTNIVALFCNRGGNWEADIFISGSLHYLLQRGLNPMDSMPNSMVYFHTL